MKHLLTEVRVPIEQDNPSILRVEEKCVKCGQCKEVCHNPIAVAGYFDLNQTQDTAICIHCGQCAVVCPVESIVQVEDYKKVQALIKDKSKVVTFSTSPSIRVALGEEFGLEPGTDVEAKMVEALRLIGGKYIFDTTFSADLTIMEEASELLERMTKGSGPLPQFTSCCPAWVKYVETFYPEMIPNLSTAKSPIGMQGPTIKTYFADNRGIDPKQMINVAITPCTAKKFEISRPEMNAAGIYHQEETMRDMDYVITTKELAKWLKEENIDLRSLKGQNYDDLLGRGSGAGVIFGNSGGVMEAALRTAYYKLTGKQPAPDLFALSPVRGMEEIKEAEITLGGQQLKVAVIHGTAHARKVIEQIKAKEVSYDFIEVMTCRGGCISGAGQPKTSFEVTDMTRFKRIAGLYNKDSQAVVKNSHDNPEIKKVYEAFYEAPLSEKAEKLLHTGYTNRSPF